jgi:hypothetical protein
MRTSNVRVPPDAFACAEQLKLGVIFPAIDFLITMLVRALRDAPARGLDDQVRTLGR